MDKSRTRFENWMSDTNRVYACHERDEEKYFEVWKAAEAATVERLNARTPAGWVSVPRYATQKQINAMAKLDLPNTPFCEIYAAAITASEEGR